MSSEVLERNARQQQTVDRLLEACAGELADVGPDRVTVRTVAARAGVSSATAYTYFDSKDHLFAELFLRHLETHPSPRVDGDATARLQAVLRAMAADLAAAPAVAAAATRALLGSDPAVGQVRTRIGAQYVHRLRAALGDGDHDGGHDGGHDPALLDTLLATVLGLLLQAGMGALTYSEMGERLASAVAVIMRGRS